MTNLDNVYKTACQAKLDAQNESVETIVHRLLTDGAESFQNGLFPNGMTVQQVADCILKTAQRYTQMRDLRMSAQDNPLTFQQMIAQNMADMTMETAANWLAGMHIMLRYLDVSEAAHKTEADLKQEYDALIEQYKNEEPQLAIEELMNTLQNPDIQRLLSNLPLSQSAQVKIDTILENYCSYEDVAIMGAIFYVEIAQDHCQGVTPVADPCVTTGRIAALCDSANVGAKLSAQELSAEDAQVQLGAIGEAFGCVLALAAALAILLGCFGVGWVAGTVLLFCGLGVNAAAFVALVAMVASFMFVEPVFEELGDFFTDALLCAKQFIHDKRKMNAANHSIESNNASQFCTSFT